MIFVPSIQNVVEETNPKLIVAFDQQQLALCAKPSSGYQVPGRKVEVESTKYQISSVWNDFVRYSPQMQSWRKQFSAHH
jgi:hypothetical protein